MGQKNEKLINDLVAGINAHPRKTVFYVEDAVVIDEKSVGDVVEAAIHAVHADAKTSAEIVRAATSIAPNRADSINAAARKAIEAESEIKRVFEKIEREQTSGKAQAQEVRTAEVANVRVAEAAEVRVARAEEVKEVIMRAIPVSPLDLKPFTNPAMQAPAKAELEK